MGGLPDEGKKHDRPDTIDYVIVGALGLYGACVVRVTQYSYEAQALGFILSIAASWVLFFGIREWIEWECRRAAAADRAGDKDDAEPPPEAEEVDDVEDLIGPLADAREAVLERNQMNEADLWSRQAFMAEHRKRLAVLGEKKEAGEITPEECESLREVADRQLAENLRKLDRATRGL